MKTINCHLFKENLEFERNFNILGLKDSLTLCILRYTNNEKLPIERFGLLGYIQRENIIGHLCTFQDLGNYFVLCQDNKYLRNAHILKFLIIGISFLKKSSILTKLLDRHIEVTD